MKKQYKIQLPKGKKVTMTNVDFEDGVMTVNVEIEKDYSNIWYKMIQEYGEAICGKKEQKYEPKDGDFIYLKWKGVKTFLPYEEGEKEAIGIFKDTRDDMLYCYVTYFVGDDFKNNPTLMMSSDYIGNKISNGYTSMFDEIRPATEEEKKLLIEKLAEANKRWNPGTKTIENVR